MVFIVFTIVGLLSVCVIHRDIEVKKVWIHFRTPFAKPVLPPATNWRWEVALMYLPFILRRVSKANNKSAIDLVKGSYLVCLFDATFASTSKPVWCLFIYVIRTFKPDMPGIFFGVCVPYVAGFISEIAINIVIVITKVTFLLLSTSVNCQFFVITLFFDVTHNKKRLTRLFIYSLLQCVR